MPSNTLKIDQIFRPFFIIREHQKTFPVDVEALAVDFGIGILHKDWPNDLSGAIGKDTKGYFLIVNRNHSALRQRYTIAHELAHRVLHRDQIEKAGIKDTWAYRSRLSEADEQAANQLAATILMPVDLLRKVAAGVVGLQSAQDAQLSVRHLAEVAGLLKVSPTALSIRLGIPT